MAKKETEEEKMMKDLGKALGGMKVVPQIQPAAGKTEYAKDSKEYKQDNK
jgi:hypothetical protein